MIKKKFKNRDELLHKSHKKKPKKLNLFYKIVLSLLVIFSMIFGYFLLLVSTAPKSIPFVTKKIESELQKSFGKNLAIKDSLIGFTRYGSVKIIAKDLSFSREGKQDHEQDEFVVQQVEAEISVIDLLTFRMRPQKIKIIKPDVVIEDDFDDADTAMGFEFNEMTAAIGSLSAIKINNFPLENFEIEDAKVVIKNGDVQKKILLKKSQIKSSMAGGVLYISSVNKVSIADLERDIEFKANCQLHELQSMKCDVIMENIIANSISKLHPKISWLNQINASIDVSASFFIKAGNLKNVNFKASAENGDFSFLNFFKSKMEFANFLVAGSYDHEIGVLNLAQIKADFVENKSPVNLDMSLLISGINNLEKRKMDFFINLKDVPNDRLDKYWPITLSDNGIRDWVISHIKGGIIRNAYTRFSLLSDNENISLEDITARVIFSGFDLNYSNHFPHITNVSGVADFTKKGMNIALNDGEVLNSRIKDSIVAIDDFSDEEVILKISGQSYGNSADSLKHANYQSEFAKYLEKYLNGDSKNSFDIRVPLSDNITLNKTYIAVSSNIANLKNDFVKGDLKISSKKDFFSNSFNTKVDLTNSELGIKALDIEKKLGDVADLGLSVVVSDKQISLKNISLLKKEKITNPKTNKVSENIAKIFGNVEFEIVPFLLTKIDLSNLNFGRNDYRFSYFADYKKSSEQVVIKAKKIDINPFVANKSFFAGSASFNSHNIDVDAANIIILNGKTLSGVKMSLDCDDGFCSKIFVRATYPKNNLFDFRTSKNPEGLGVLLKGRITDVGYIAEGFGFSNVVSGGDLKLSGKTFFANKSQIFAGEIKVDEGITIYENASVKRLSKDTLFSQIKDKIFSSEKTTFDSVKVNFELSRGNINISSLVANNYKVGITAKGNLNLKEDSYNIKGMIVPGFIINNLFGIGNIPIIGGVISGILTGGEGGGVFGIRYEYVKDKGDKEGKFTTNKVSSFVPTTIKNLFDLI